MKSLSSMATWYTVHSICAVTVFFACLNFTMIFTLILQINKLDFTAANQLE